MTEELTERQKTVMDYIRKYYKEYGCSPTIREIQAFIHVDSTQTVHNILKQLEDAGLIRRDREKQRAITIIKKEHEYRLAPLVKKLCDPELIFDVHNIETYYPLPPNLRQEKMFMYRMQGHSLVEERILDEDILIFSMCDEAKDGDFVAALADCSPLVRMLGDNGKVLKAANRSFADVVPQKLQIIGKLVCFMRYYNAL